VGRPAMQVGTWGKVRRTELAPDRWEAAARFRDYDGKTREVTTAGPTGAAAERKLLAALRDRARRSDGDVTDAMHVSQLAALWLEEITDEQRVKPQTVDRYRGIVEHAINPTLGSLSLREVTVSTADRFLKAYAKDHPAQAQSIKQVLGQIMGMAVRHDALATNPVRSVARLRTVRKDIRALEVEQLHEVRRLVREWRKPAPGGKGPVGPKPSGDLPDVIDIFLATGLRINEVLALRWSDIDLAATQPTLSVTGTLVQVKGKGLIRQPVPKSEAGRRTMMLPAFASAVLLDRRVNSRSNLNDAVFATRNGTWVSAHNVRRQWRAIREGTGLDWVTPHTFRKTVATMVESELGSKVAAAQLGHASEAMTEGYYIVKTHVVPDTTHALDKLAPRASAKAGPAT
jgi:integrase